MKMVRIYKWFGVVVLGSIGAAMLFLLVVNLWGVYQFRQMIQGERWQAQSERCTATPQGSDLLALPLWKDCFTELLHEPPMHVDPLTGAFPPPVRTNALSLWREMASDKEAFLSMNSERAAEKREGNLNPGTLATRELPSYVQQLDQIETRIAELERALSTNAEAAPGSLQKRIASGEEISVLELQKTLKRNFDKSDLSAIQKNLTSWTTHLAKFEDLALQGNTDITEAQAAALLLGYRQEGDETFAQIQETLGQSTFQKYDFLFQPGTLELITIQRLIAREAAARASLHARLGMKADAYSDLECLLRLSELQDATPTLIGGLVNVGIRSITANTIHTLILEGALADQELLEVQTRLSQWNLMEKLSQTLEGESFYSQKMLLGQSSQWAGGIPVGNFLTDYVIPGIVKMNLTVYAQAFWECQECINLQTQTIDLERWRAALNPRGMLGTFLFNMMAPPLNQASLKWMRLQSERDVSILGCALERYHLKNGRYPESLEELLPNYLEAMPAGAKEQRSLTYQLEGEGYELHSNKNPALAKESKMDVTWKR